MPGGRSVGNRIYRVEGIHEGRITAQEYVGWRQFPINQEFTSEGQTLGVPTGWNKPVSRCRRRFCREVAKTWGQGALGVEARFARRTMMALKGAEPKKVPVPSRCRCVDFLEVGGSLKEDSKHSAQAGAWRLCKGLEGDSERLRLGVTNARHSATVLRL
jgi:hypothetical protein